MLSGLKYNFGFPGIAEALGDGSVGEVQVCDVNLAGVGIGEEHVPAIEIHTVPGHIVTAKRQHRSSTVDDVTGRHLRDANAATGLPTGTAGATRGLIAYRNREWTGTRAAFSKIPERSQVAGAPIYGEIVVPHFARIGTLVEVAGQQLRATKIEAKTCNADVWLGAVLCNGFFQIRPLTCGRINGVGYTVAFLVSF
jgi:hypothetical protein